MQDMGDSAYCWICLDGPTDREPLQTPCSCTSRPVHSRCLARWQLQAAGKAEEMTCRFCHQRLPDWRQSLLPSQQPTVKAVRPMMAIKFNGCIYKVRVEPGADGLATFKQQVRQLLGFDINEDFEVSFECTVPSTGEKLNLTGLSSYAAATDCAALAAAERRAQTPPPSVPPCRHDSPQPHITTEPRPHTAPLPAATRDLPPARHTLVQRARQQRGVHPEPLLPLSAAPADRPATAPHPAWPGRPSRTLNGQPTHTCPARRPQTAGNSPAHSHPCLPGRIPSCPQIPLDLLTDAPAMPQRSCRSGVPARLLATEPTSFFDLFAANPVPPGSLSARATLASSSSVNSTTPTTTITSKVSLLSKASRLAKDAMKRLFSTR